LRRRRAARKATRWLHRALSETGKGWDSKVAIHNREYLSCVKPDGLFLILDLMHFAQEVLEPEGLSVVRSLRRAP